MEDQVTALREYRNFNQVAFLNSDLTIIERQSIITQTKEGQISILYMSPELLLSYNIEAFLGERQLGLLIIDEAHLVSTWGRDFRIDYWFLGNYIRKLRRGSSINGLENNQLITYRFPVVALTATAVFDGTHDMVFKTIGSLNMQHPRIYIGRIKREDISFEINNFEINHSHELEKNNKTKERIAEFINNDQKSIFYFPWISQIEDITRTFDSDINPFFVRKYHAKLDSRERTESLTQFKTGVAKSVLATKAFGMGIDINDVQIVYHHAPSGSLADYVQEIGRAARKHDLNGTAVMDFNPKDLKFSKILFGMSSLKQYQADLVLKKLNNLFQVKQNRNMLVSIEDFQYIFPEDKDPEQKVKSALLLIEKDLIAKFDYNVIIVRPKSLNSTVFGSIKNENFDSLNNQYGFYITEIRGTQYEQPAVNLGGIANTIIIRENNNDIRYLQIRLDKLWEDHFQEESFPTIKYKFFNNQLLENVNPLFKIEIHFKDSIEQTKETFQLNIASLENAISAMNGYFTKDELKQQLNNIFDEHTKAKLADLLTVFYKKENDDNEGFLHVKENYGQETKYRIYNAGFLRVKASMIRRFETLFTGIPEEYFCGFINVNNSQGREKIKLTYLLEIFGLCTYEINGGKFPQIFVRINDPKKLDTLSRSKYTNRFVSEIENSHEVSIGIMNYFFQQPMTNIERWVYIEDYFLGKEVKYENSGQK